MNNFIAGRKKSSVEKKVIAGIMIMLGYSVSKESYRVTKGIMEYRVVILGAPSTIIFLFIFWMN